MKKENLVKWLGKKVLPYLMVGAMAFGSYKCADNFVEPEPEKPPVAMLIAQPTGGDAPLEVRLDGSRSWAHKGSIVKYYWDVNGDGETDETTLEAYIDHVYEAGNYDPILVVEDSQGQKSNEARLLEKIVVNEDIISLGQIAFWSNRDVLRGVYNEEIYSGNIVLRVKDNKINLRSIKRLTTDPEQDFEPAWSPDGKEILFTSNRTGEGAIWRMNADGTNQRDITSDIIERAQNADWGSNGNILVTYMDSGIAGIGVINPYENSFISIYSEVGISHIPGWSKWSPDCSKIAFQKHINGNWDIHTMNADGTNLRNLTNNPATDQQPTWSSDGRILFLSDRANPYQNPRETDLYLMNADGSNITRLTNAPGGEYDPVIFPDGKYLLFSNYGQMEDSFQLYLTELTNAGDVSKWVQLTTKGQNRYLKLKPEIED